MGSMAERVHFLTPEGKDKLQKELDYLRNVRRPEIAESLRSAVDEGDLSENSGYEESKREQAFVEGRIRDLQAILSSAQILVESPRRDIVCLGCRVTISEDGREPETYQIVGRTEADPTQGRISNESPLGKALLGRRSGDEVTVQSPDGALRFEVLTIE
jgi:transcription elongation factor GreA